MLSKSKFKITLILLVVVGLFNVTKVEAKERNIVNIYFFHSDSCSHCQSELKLLNKLEKKYNNVNIYFYEISENDNEELMLKIGILYKVDITGVPVTIIGDTIYTGYSEEYSSNKFIKTIEYYSRYGYEDRVANYLGINTDSLYKVNSSDMSLEEFMSSYNNYKLIFNVYTDDIDISYISLIIGGLLGLNIFNIIGILIIIYSYKKDTVKLLKIGLIYIFSNVILYTIYNIINNFYISIIIGIILLIIYVLIKDIKYKEYFFSILLSSIINIINLLIFNNYLDIINNLLYLNSYNVLYSLIFYMEVYFIYIFLFIFIFMLLYMLIDKLKNKCSTNKIDLN